MNKARFIMGMVLGVLLVVFCYSGNAYAKADGEWMNTNGYWWFSYSDGSFAMSEYIDGYWIDSTGMYDSEWNGGWKSDSTGWWYQSGDWYPVSSWLKIDGDWYYFKNTGYMACSEWIGDYYLTDSGAMAVNEWIDGDYYVGDDGEWQENKKKAGSSENDKSAGVISEELKEAINYCKNLNGDMQLSKFLEYFGFASSKYGYSYDKKTVVEVTNESPKIIEIWNNNSYYKIKLKSSGDYKFTYGKGKYYITISDMLSLYNFIKKGDVSGLEIQNSPHTN